MFINVPLLDFLMNTVQTEKYPISKIGKQNEQRITLRFYLLFHIQLTFHLSFSFSLFTYSCL